MVVFELLGSLGLGQQVMTAATIGAVAWYLFRGKSAASTFAAGIGTVTTVVMGTLATLAVAIALGWVDPDIAKLTGDVLAAGTTVLEWLASIPVDIIKGVLP